jgi:hypothetical protein
MRGIIKTIDINEVNNEVYYMIKTEDGVSRPYFKELHRSNKSLYVGQDVEITFYSCLYNDYVNSIKPLVLTESMMKRYEDLLG